MLAVSLCLLLVIPVAVHADPAGPLRDPTDQDVLSIFSLMRGTSGELISRLLTSGQLSGEEWEELQYDLNLDTEMQAKLEPELHVTCLECRTYLALLKGIIAQGVQFEDVRDDVVEICYGLAADEGVRGDILCPGTIDLQGPHVYKILNETTYSADKMCQLANACPYQEGPRRQYAATDNRKSAESSGSRPRRNLREGTLKVMHFTDIHVDEKYFTGAATDCGLPLCCREDWNGTGVAGEWGAYTCNLPPRTLEHMMSSLNQLEPDVILYSGDSPPHALWEETIESQLAVSEYVSSLFTNLMPGIPTFSAIGNHETYPTNLYYPPMEETQFFNEQFLHFWGELGDLGEEQEATIRRSGYYSILVRPDLRVVNYNTNYGYNMNFYNMLSLEEEYFEEMRDWLQAELQTARDNGEKVLLNGHHPSGSSGVFVPYAWWISELVEAYADVILLHVSGHHHDDFFRLVVDEEGNAQNVMYVGPTAGTRTNHNPTVRLFYLDEETLELLDFENYYLDLNEAMASMDPPDMKLLYSATEEYGMSDLSPASWMDLTFRFEEDQDLFMKYVYNLKSRSSVPGDCSGDCKIKEICRCRTSSYDAYEECRASLL